MRVRASKAGEPRTEGSMIAPVALNGTLLAYPRQAGGCARREGGTVKAGGVIFAALLVVALLTATPSASWPQRADDLPGPPQNGRFGDPTLTGRNLQNFVYGVIKSIGSDEIVCDKTEFGDNQPFLIDKKTKYVRDGQSSTSSDLKIGDKTWVKIRKDKKSGDMTALLVVTGEVPADAKIR